MYRIDRGGSTMLVIFQYITLFFQNWAPGRRFGIFEICYIRS